MDERPEVGELAARGGMEGRRLHLRQPERLQPMAHLGRGLLGEGHDQRLLRVDRLVAAAYATRWLMTRVLPVPAPARMTTGPVVAVAASRCSSFRPARMASGSIR